MTKVSPCCAWLFGDCDVEVGIVGPKLTKDVLAIALRRFRETDEAEKVKFTVRYYPYQLYPEAPKEGEDKYEWYKKSRYGNSEEKMQTYTTLMTAYGVSAGIDFKFGGTVANTLDAHRLIQHYQEEKGLVTADKLINGLHEFAGTFLKS